MYQNVGGTATTISSDLQFQVLTMDRWNSDLTHKALKQAYQLLCYITCSTFSPSIEEKGTYKLAAYLRIFVKLKKDN